MPPTPLIAQEPYELREEARKFVDETNAAWARLPERCAKAETEQARLDAIEITKVTAKDIDARRKLRLEQIAIAQAELPILHGIVGHWAPMRIGERHAAFDRANEARLGCADQIGKSLIAAGFDPESLPVGFHPKFRRAAEAADEADVRRHQPFGSAWIESQIRERESELRELLAQAA